MSMSEVTVHENVDPMENVADVNTSTLFVSSELIPPEENYGNMEEIKHSPNSDFSGNVGPYQIKEECAEQNTEHEMLVEQTQSTEQPLAVEHLDPLATTHDECMAVEALRQLGELYTGPIINTPVINSTPQFSCELCGLQFHMHFELQNHRISCVRQPVNPSYVCKICGERFERKIDLGNHTVCHQVGRPHACRICGNLFRRKAYLLNHMKCHQDNRPHRCQECGVNFHRPSSLTNHMKIHTYSPGRALIPTDIPMQTDNKESSNNNVNHTSETIQPIPPFKTLKGNNSYTNFRSTTTTTTTTNSNNNNNNNNLVSTKLADAGMLQYETWNINYTYDNTTTNEMGNEGALNVNEIIHKPVAGTNSDGMTSPMSINTYEPKHFPPIVPKVNQPDVVTSHYFENSATVVRKPIPETIQQQIIPVEESQSGNVVHSEGHDDAVKVEAMPYLPLVDTKPEEVGFTPPPIMAQEQTVGALLIPNNRLNMRRPHVCRHCNKAFARSTALASHVRLHEDWWGSPLECTKCEEMFPEIIALRMHQAKCPGKPLQQQIIQTPPALNSEQKHPAAGPPAAVVPKVGKHPCTECEKRFTTKQKLFRHSWIHRKKAFQCEICSSNLSDQTTLEEHRRMQHPGDMPYRCKTCGRSFASRQGMWEHDRGVHGATVFWCNLCDKTFASRQGYLIHTRTHTGERPYGCRYCWKAFRDGGTLRKHERIHTGERPHACPLCQRAFNQKVVLREHVRWVHAAKKKGSGEDELYICLLCKRICEDREELCAHIVQHSDNLAATAKATAATKESNKVQTKRPPKKRRGKVIVTKPRVPVPVTSHPNVVLQEVSSRFPASQTYPPTYYAPHTIQAAQGSNQCDMCGHAFASRTELLQHVQIHI